MPDFYIFFSPQWRKALHNPEYQFQIWDLDPDVYVHKCSVMKKQSLFIEKKKKVTRNVVDSLNHMLEEVHNEESSDKPHLALLAPDVKHMWFVCSLSVYTVHIHTDLKNKSSLQNSRDPRPVCFNTCWTLLLWCQYHAPGGKGRSSSFRVTIQPKMVIYSPPCCSNHIDFCPPSNTKRDFRQNV